MGLKTIHLETMVGSGGVFRSVPKESIGSLAPRDSTQLQRLSVQAAKDSDHLKLPLFFFNTGLGVSKVRKTRRKYS